MTLVGLLRRIEDRSARVAVIGQGFVGLALAMEVSRVGFVVTGLETNPARLASLEAGRSYVDDVTDDDLRAAQRRGYSATADAAAIAGFDVAVITVPTPLREGQPDLSSVAQAADVVGGALRDGGLVILESTTYPGTTEELVVPRLEAASGLRVGGDLLVGYSPERIDPGNERFHLANTPKIVAGIDSASRQAVEAFYGTLIETLVPVRSLAEAELAKLIENTFRHVSIALVNELAMFAHDLGVDIWAAIDAASTKPFGFMPFRPGPGVGGHCLPVDPSYLSWRVKRRLGETFRFVELANDINDHMPTYVVRRVQEMLNRAGLAVRGRRILVLGLAYKAGTGDLRESPSLAIVERLRELGAEVAVCDPHIAARPDLTIEPVVLDAAAVSTADLVLLLTDHAEFDYDLVVREATRIFDTRDRLRSYDAPHIERL